MPLITVTVACFLNYTVKTSNGSFSIAEQRIKPRKRHINADPLAFELIAVSAWALDRPCSNGFHFTPRSVITGMFSITFFFIVVGVGSSQVAGRLQSQI